MQRREATERRRLPFLLVALELPVFVIPAGENQGNQYPRENERDEQ